MSVEPGNRHAVNADRGDDAFASASLVAQAVAPATLASLLDLDVPAAARRGLDAALFDPALGFTTRPAKHWRARLVEIGWRLGGGPEPLPPALASVVESIHAGSLIVDDIEDGSAVRRGAPALHRQIGLPLALNVGNWLYVLPLHLLPTLAVPPAVELELHRCITTAMSRCHVGQALDLSLRSHAVGRADVRAAAATITALKTGALTELAMIVGAIAGGAAPARVAALGRFGRRFGMALQMFDDIGNLRTPDATRRCEDVRLGRVTWVWAWLAERARPAHFARLQRQARAVAAGRLAAERLGERLAALVAAHGQREAEQTVARALLALERAIGQVPALTELRDAAARLTVGYG